MKHCLALCLSALLLSACAAGVSAPVVGGSGPYDPTLPDDQAYDLQGNPIMSSESDILGHGLSIPLADSDVDFRYQAQQRALERTLVGRETEWSNDATGHSGIITPTKTYTVGDKYCRSYTESAKIGGKLYESRGDACRANDGVWQEQEGA